MDRKQVDFGREKEVFPLVLIQVKSAAKRTVFDLKNKREKTFLPFKTQLFHIQVVRYAVYGKYVRLFPGGHNEAPAIFKKDGTYWMITSGCTGWAPNAARLFSAPFIWGPWTQHPNPCRGEGSDKTFGGQSTYVLQLPGNRYLFMADIWRPKSLMYSEYLWIPVRFDEEGMPYLTLSGKCNLSDGR